MRQRNFFGQVADGILDMDPLLAFVEMDIAQAVGFDDIELLVFTLAQVGVDDHGPVVTAMNQIRVVAVLEHGSDDTIQLPRSGGGGRDRRSARRC